MNTTPARDPGNLHLSGRVARLRRLPAPPVKWKFPSGCACGAGVPQSRAALQFIPAGLARWRHLETPDERSFPVRPDHLRHHPLRNRHQGRCQLHTRHFEARHIGRPGPERRERLHRDLRPVPHRQGLRELGQLGRQPQEEGRQADRQRRDPLQPHREGWPHLLQHRHRRRRDRVSLSLTGRP